MSELKATTVYDAYWKANSVGKGTGILIYLKSEADKVIMEKNKEIQRLENLCESYRIDCDNLAIREANACKEIERDNKQIRHQKYKRCLAMADYAIYHHFRMLEIHGRSLDNNRAVFKLNYGLRWRCKWLELAEKFKEAR
jgi:hypothetical protein